MKKFLFLCLFLFFFIPVKAQYLLEGKKTKEPKNSYQEQLKERKDYDVYSREDSNSVGYRGFFDFGLGFGITNNYNNSNSIMLSTTHGCQIIDNYLYIGGGLGYWYMYNEGESALPLFVDFRSDFYNFGKCNIFADLKVGYSVVCAMGFFSNPQIGIRYKLADNLGLNAGIGFQCFNDTYEGVLGSFNIKVGIDF